MVGLPYTQATKLLLAFNAGGSLSEPRRVSLCNVTSDGLLEAQRRPAGCSFKLSPEGSMVLL